MPDPILRSPRIDATAADMRSLVQLGTAEPQPVPASPPEPAPEPDAADEQEAALLSAALTEAGVDTAAEDQAAARAIATLDPTTVAAVQRWIAAPRKAKPETPSK